MNTSADVHNDSAGLMPIVQRLSGLMLAAGAVCFLFTLFWGFELRNLFGFGIGTLNACFSLWLLARTVNKAVECNVKRAKRLMIGCFALRMAILTALCAVGFFTGAISVVGVIVPQLFPKILLTFDHFSGINYIRKE